MPVLGCSFLVFELTSDEGCDLVLAGPNAVLHFTDKSGVDGLVHLQYLQLVVFDLDRVWHLSCHTVGTWAQVEWDYRLLELVQTNSIQTDIRLKKTAVLHDIIKFHKSEYSMQNQSVSPRPQEVIHYQTAEEKTMGRGEKSKLLHLGPKSHLFHFKVPNFFFKFSRSYVNSW